MQPGIWFKMPFLLYREDCRLFNCNIEPQVIVFIVMAFHHSFLMKEWHNASKSTSEFILCMNWVWYYVYKLMSVQPIPLLSNLFLLIRNAQFLQLQILILTICMRNDLSKIDFKNLLSSVIGKWIYDIFFKNCVHPVRYSVLEIYWAQFFSCWRRIREESHFSLCKEEKKKAIF